MNYCTFLNLGRYGRFANGIFQVCGTIGVARKNNMEPVFPLWINHDHRERFGSDEDVDLYKHFVNPLPSLPEGLMFLEHHVPWGYSEISLARRNYNLQGHMQSVKFFRHCMDEVRHYMKMKDEYEQNDSVALHWRLGDYDDKYHPRLTLEYYSKAIEQFREGTHFLVFSDEIDQVSDILTAHYGSDPEGKRFRYVKGDYIDSFKLMKSCSHFIIGNSSYSAAAAILSGAKDKKVVAPANWFGSAYTGITAKDIYCPDWVVI
jgi:hypothetical protein